MSRLHFTVPAQLFERYLPLKTACQNPREYSAAGCSQSVLLLLEMVLPIFFRYWYIREDIVIFIFFKITFSALVCTCLSEDQGIINDDFFFLRAGKLDNV